MDKIFKLEIGDWSNDGHGMSETLYYKTNGHPSLAYEEAKKTHPTEIHPSEIFKNYGDTKIDKEIADQIFEAYPELKEAPYEWRERDGKVWFSYEMLGFYTILFCKSADPDMEVEPITLPKVTWDPIGYGLFE